MTDEELMDIARPFAADGGRWPSDWIAAMRVAVEKEREAYEKLLDNVGATLQTDDKSNEFWSGVGAMVEAGEKAIRKRSNVKVSDCPAAETTNGDKTHD